LTTEAVEPKKGAEYRLLSGFDGRCHVKRVVLSHHAVFLRMPAGMTETLAIKGLNVIFFWLVHGMALALLYWMSTKHLIHRNIERRHHEHPIQPKHERAASIGPE